jgi:PhzF family phenazine biosynthesis protein
MIEFVSGLIDVFAQAPLAGNPLAVVEGADGLDEGTMRRIAREFNQAETTFLMKSDRADRRLRSFTASGVEVGGAGHNALGAWLWLGHRGALGALTTPATFRQEIGDDVLPITLREQGGRPHAQMRQAPLRLAPPLARLAPLAEALRLAPGDLLADPPARAADTGAAHLLVRARDRDAVDRATPRAQALLEVLGPAGAEGCYLYAFDEAEPGGAYARFFNPTVGLWEDAATGTAAGPLAAYLGAEGRLAASGELTVEQGVRMGRRSLLRVRLTPDPELCGSGVVVLQGVLRL